MLMLFRASGKQNKCFSTMIAKDFVSTSNSESLSRASLAMELDWKFCNMRWQFQYAGPQTEAWQAACQERV